MIGLIFRASSGYLRLFPSSSPIGLFLQHVWRVSGIDRQTSGLSGFLLFSVIYSSTIAFGCNCRSILWALYRADIH